MNTYLKIDAPQAIFNLMLPLDAWHLREVLRRF